jgi:methylmalonyl-CoA mutase N-terminal domain/subunit
MTSGILRGIEDGWFMAEIAEASFTYQQQLEKGEKKVVGVNSHESVGEPELEILRISGDVETEQVRALGERRAGRDEDAVRSALAAMLDAARSEANLVPPMLAAARAEATLGEICGALRDEWGAYTEPARF